MFNTTLIPDFQPNYYATVADANSKVAPSARYQGKSVFVRNGSGILTEYWYKDGVEDSDLVLKAPLVGGGGSGSGGSFIFGVQQIDVSTGEDIYQFPHNLGVQPVVVACRGMNSTAFDLFTTGADETYIYIQFQTVPAPDQIVFVNWIGIVP